MHPIMQNTNICLCRKENKTLGGASTKATWHRTTDFLSCAWWLGEVSVADRGGGRECSTAVVKPIVLASGNRTWVFSAHTGQQEVVERRLSTIPFVFVVLNRFIWFWIDGFGLVACTDRSLGTATNTTTVSIFVRLKKKKSYMRFKTRRSLWPLYYYLLLIHSQNSRYAVLCVIWPSGCLIHLFFFFFATVRGA